MTHIRAELFDSDFFSSFEHSAWRLELLDEYDEPSTRLRMAQLQRGERLAPNQWWLEGLQAAQERGASVGRVHVVGQLTDYLRYELSVYESHAAAGEDIRILRADVAARLDLPDFDYWLLDDTAVFRLDYGPRGVLLGEEMITDLATVARCVQVRKAATRLALPLAQYQREVAA